MKRIEVEAFSDAINSPVLKLPNRSYPGILIQGDSLSILYTNAKVLSEMCKDLSGTEGQDGPAELSQELFNLLSGYLEHYKSILKENNIELPFNSR